jgi:hypothetical protein
VLRTCEQFESIFHEAHKSFEYHHNYKTGDGPIIVDGMTVVGGEPLLELFGLKFPLLVRCSQ